MSLSENLTGRHDQSGACYVSPAPRLDRERDLRHTPSSLLVKSNRCKLTPRFTSTAPWSASTMDPTEKTRRIARVSDTGTQPAIVYPAKCCMRATEKIE